MHTCQTAVLNRCIAAYMWVKQYWTMMYNGVNPAYAIQDDAMSN